jgi:hypothetical protein
MEIEDDNIHKFWQWFVKNESIIKECIENEDSRQRETVVDHLNELILSIGVFTWDVGLNDDENWFLMISPNGNEEMMNIAHEIMEEAPKHMDWHFYAGKPAKKHWNRQFTIYDAEMDAQFIDATRWHFLVFVDEDGSLELVIEAKNSSHLDEETAESAAEYFVTHEVGESMRIRTVSSLVIVSELDKEDEDSKISVNDLKAYLDGMN